MIYNESIEDREKQLFWVRKYEWVMDYLVHSSESTKEPILNPFVDKVAMLDVPRTKQ